MWGEKYSKSLVDLHRLTKSKSVMLCPALPYSKHMSLYISLSYSNVTLPVANIQTDQSDII